MALDPIEFHWASVTRAQETGNPAVLGYLPQTTPFFSSALTAMHHRWDLPFLTPFDGVLTEEQTAAKLNTYLFPVRTLLSVSALEMYARCPFRYFLTVAWAFRKRRPRTASDDSTARPRDFAACDLA